jgi:hypothetical protein
MYELCATLASRHAPHATQPAASNGVHAPAAVQAGGAPANGEAGDPP